MRTFPDQVYAFTFHATGCPNSSPASGLVGWWATLSKENVFNDMHSYCELTRTGSATEYQKTTCCGNIDCTVNNCAKQVEWVLGI